MTERTFLSLSTGPVVLGLDLPVGSLTVQVLSNITTASVVLRTDDESGPAADAINGARSSQDGQALAVEVPELPGNVMTQSVSGRRVVQHAGTVNGAVTGVTINGCVVTGGGNAGVVTVSPIEARVILPIGSALAVVSQSSDARVYGNVERMEFRSVSGDLAIDGARELNATTTSGDVAVGHLTERLTVRSVSGDITLYGYAGAEADLTTTSGDIDVMAQGRASGDLRAHSVSGDVSVTGSGALRVNVRSVSGRVRTR
ncbi:DUF4097 family beta strand repeat-containing protein [Streptomyces agglomeratus]|uniref:DUF4097 family beta strand repeat-containing protein n=1 Tax=Streptomyces agglomeratus TaxID=285458 RepID=UPI000853F6C8|nr:DUF4097 family beta strand repeat-containing protein [Streptomyces agglomeratus]OEJ53497.1 hypothetical protein BGK72_24630 [Streptomyces agglomeratus]